VKNPRIETYESTRKGLEEQGLSPEEVKDRWVFHTNPDLEISQKIASTNLRPSNCQTCKGGHRCTDPGFYGDHTKGVYVSKHADYTFYYQKGHKAEVEKNDIGAVIMMKMFTGKIKHLDNLALKEPPTLGYNCHETQNFMEYYVWDTKQIMPCYIIYWQAIQNTRMIKEEGVEEKKVPDRVTIINEQKKQKTLVITTTSTFGSLLKLLNKNVQEYEFQDLTGATFDPDYLLIQYLTFGPQGDSPVIYLKRTQDF